MTTCTRPIGLFLALAAALVFTGCSKDPEVAKREHLARGNAYVAENKHREAVIEYRNAVQADPTFGEARFRLAKAYGQLKDWPNAYVEYRTRRRAAA